MFTILYHYIISRVLLTVCLNLKLEFSNSEFYSFVSLTAISPLVRYVNKVNIFVLHKNSKTIYRPNEKKQFYSAKEFGL